jgi:glutamate-1-semialdehyde aminotransferase
MRNDIDSEANETADLSRLIPPINRARDYRLYTQDGRRLVDLWQYGGRAVLGHNPPGVLRELKNSAERGLFVPLPHPRDKRL